jgi:hypothetical protein
MENPYKLVELGEEDVAAQAFDREFVAVSICRDDLVEGLGATVKYLQFLTNEDMERIASFVSEAYIQYGRFWEDLLEATNRLLTEKGGPRLRELLTENATEEETIDDRKEITDGNS